MPVHVIPWDYEELCSQLKLEIKILNKGFPDNIQIDIRIFVALHSRLLNQPKGVGIQQH